MFSYVSLHTDEQGLGHQLEPICNSSVLIQDVAWKTCRKQWTIETSGEREKGKSVQAAWHDDDDDDDYNVSLSIQLNISHMFTQLNDRTVPFLAIQFCKSFVCIQFRFQTVLFDP